ncbi:hypothetical protein SEA_COLUCCI_105 [Arthrobacter phage Colucci]|uniref:Uncharacterized protein n=1 Tax=Arthrobacter phage Colucci TaxID=2015834 RepID=A0A286N317_9CAUD|nr:hypothetical protein FDI27_gp105 [Arthrobacter phage Colucci]ASX98774.1 hypothetical protein SEA_COLUCCI_105 [Arthrobacter phage Colucci]
MPTYTTSNTDVYQGATMTNDETGHSVKEADYVTVGKSKNEWFVNRVLWHGLVEIERQKPKGGLTHRRVCIDDLTVTLTTRTDAEYEEVPMKATEDAWPTAADLVAHAQALLDSGEAVDLDDALDAADDLFPEVPDGDDERRAFHRRAEGIMQEAVKIMEARAVTDTPTPLLHPKREVFDVKASLDGKRVVETITVQGNIKRARSVADMLACKHGFGPLVTEFHTNSLECHQGRDGGVVEIEDMDADFPETGPWDEEMTYERSVIDADY